MVALHVQQRAVLCTDNLFKFQERFRSFVTNMACSSADVNFNDEGVIFLMIPIPGCLADPENPENPENP